jgi:hypothetical protein
MELGIILGENVSPCLCQFAGVFSVSQKGREFIHMCILGRLWVRDDFAPLFLDIRSCVSLSVRKASRFIVFIFCSHFYCVH